LSGAGRRPAAAAVRACEPADLAGAAATAFDHTAAPVGDHAALGADFGASDRRAAALFRGAPAAASRRELAVAAMDRRSASVRRRAAVGPEICARDRQATSASIHRSAAAAACPGRGRVDRA
jgi:hypothetical protein